MCGSRLIVEPPAGGRCAREWGMTDDGGFAAGFFDRADPADDAAFYTPHGSSPTSTTARSPRSARSTTSSASRGDVLDLMSSWVSHFRRPPAALVGARDERRRAGAPTRRGVEPSSHDLNADPRLPFADASFDAATCCVSVDYLVRPVEVFGEVARVLRPGGLFVCTFSNRCFPTKAIRGWLTTDDGRVARSSSARTSTAPAASPRPRRSCGRSLDSRGDPLWAVWSTAVR